MYLRIYAEELCEGCGLSLFDDEVEECDECEDSLKIDPAKGYWIDHCYGC
jgi:hypothetical protein